MLRMQNKYCSNCLRTQRFLDLGVYLVCERCSKRLERLERRPEPAARADVPHAPWAERAQPLREAM